MTTPSYPIHDLFNIPETVLGKLFAQAKSIQELNNTFSQVLEDDLISHCRVGYYHQGVLILYTDNASFATRLRYQTPQLLSKLRKSPKWAGICSIQVKVQVHKPIELQTKNEIIKLPTKVPLSQHSKDQLMALSAFLENEPGAQKLSESLKRLAQDITLSKKPE